MIANQKTKSSCKTEERRDLSILNEKIKLDILNRRITTPYDAQKNFSALVFSNVILKTLRRTANIQSEFVIRDLIGNLEYVQCQKYLCSGISQTTISKYKKTWSSTKKLKERWELEKPQKSAACVAHLLNDNALATDSKFFARFCRELVNVAHEAIDLVLSGTMSIDQVYRDKFKQLNKKITYLCQSGKQGRLSWFIKKNQNNIRSHVYAYVRDYISLFEAGKLTHYGRKNPATFTGGCLPPGVLKDIQTVVMARLRTCGYTKEFEESGAQYLANKNLHTCGVLNKARPNHPEGCSFIVKRLIREYSIGICKNSIRKSVSDVSGKIIDKLLPDMWHYLDVAKEAKAFFELSTKNRGLNNTINIGLPLFLRRKKQKSSVCSFEKENLALDCGVEPPPNRNFAANKIPLRGCGKKTLTVTAGSLEPDTYWQKKIIEGMKEIFKEKKEEEEEKKVIKFEESVSKFQEQQRKASEAKAKMDAILAKLTQPKG